MPSYIVHLAVASEVIKKESIQDKSYIEKFVVGSIAADTSERTEKRENHFWDDDTYKCLDRKPNLQMFLEKYSHRLEEPFIRGYYGHLYMDYIFVDEYWKKHFTLLNQELDEENKYDEVEYIRLNDNGVVYPRKDFLSDSMYYGDYDIIPQYIHENYDIILPELKCCNMDLGYEYIKDIKEVNYIVAKSQLEIMINKVKISMTNNREDGGELLVFKIEEIYDLIRRTVEHLTNIK